MMENSETKYNKGRTGEAGVKRRLFLALLFVMATAQIFVYFNIPEQGRWKVMQDSLVYLFAKPGEIYFTAKNPIYDPYYLLGRKISKDIPENSKVAFFNDQQDGSELFYYHRLHAYMEGKKEYHFIHEPHLTYSETIERMKSENCDFRVIYNQPQELKRLFNLNAKTAVLKLENNKLKIVSYYD